MARGIAAIEWHARTSDRGVLAVDDNEAFVGLDHVYAALPGQLSVTQICTVGSHHTERELTATLAAALA